MPYREALAVQQVLFDHGSEQHLLLLEHDHVFTYGPHADLTVNLRCEPSDVGADLVAVKRGGDITYHGPGQLVGYPIVAIPNAKGSLEHVRNVEQLLIDVLDELGVAGAGRLAGHPGVWVDCESSDPRKIAAIWSGFTPCPSLERPVRCVGTSRKTEVACSIFLYGIEDDSIGRCPPSG